MSIEPYKRMAQLTYVEGIIEKCNENQKVTEDLKSVINNKVDMLTLLLNEIGTKPGPTRLIYLEEELTKLEEFSNKFNELNKDIDSETTQKVQTIADGVVTARNQLKGRIADFKPSKLKEFIHTKKWIPAALAALALAAFFLAGVSGGLKEILGEHDFELLKDNFPPEVLYTISVALTALAIYKTYKYKTALPLAENQLKLSGKQEILLKKVLQEVSESDRKEEDEDILVEGGSKQELDELYQALDELYNSRQFETSGMDLTKRLNILKGLKNLAHRLKEDEVGSRLPAIELYSSQDFSDYIDCYEAYYQPNDFEQFINLKTPQEYMSDLPNLTEAFARLNETSRKYNNIRSSKLLLDEGIPLMPFDWYQNSNLPKVFLDGQLIALGRLQKGQVQESEGQQQMEFNKQLICKLIVVSIAEQEIYPNIQTENQKLLKGILQNGKNNFLIKDLPQSLMERANRLT